ncbi:DUF4870 domain-containing protein [Promicromonospora sp. MEB111]|uniref:DUF4870 domain-containing protein n=1 Tax=unclassified Promicromonospora TaxID=2647929 RepID=UPI00254A51E1|nr:DUF4870 domain-containing protein [Promicromonospora sp. MEB111]
MSENPQEPQAPQQPGPAPQQPGPAPQQPQDAPAYGTPQPQSPYQGPPQAGPAYSGPYQPQPLTPSDERMWTVFAQIGPFLVSFIAPLVIWLVLRERSQFVDQEAKESLNFQITMVIAQIAAAIITAITFGIGGIVYLAFIAAIVFMILAAVANGKGAPYRYPVNIRFIK